jgi:hypothetical protein
MNDFYFERPTMALLIVLPWFSKLLCMIATINNGSYCVLKKKKRYYRDIYHDLFLDCQLQPFSPAIATKITHQNFD